MLVEMVLTLFQATAAREEVFQPQMEVEAVVPSCWVKIIYLFRSLFFPHCLVTVKQAASSGEGRRWKGNLACSET